MLADITPVVLTYSEAANIGRSVERLTWAKEVVIVDSNSTDDTLAIANRFPNVRTVQRRFDTHAQQWRFAIEQTGITGGWVLRLDADYMVEPALRDEIAALTPAEETAAYEIVFTYCIDSRPLRASLYPALPVLFRRGRGRFVSPAPRRRRVAPASTREPVVCRPEEAIDWFLRTKMDVLVPGDAFIRR